MLGLLVMLLAASVNAKTHSMQYHMHVSRNTRSNGPPIQTGYVYSQLNNDPGKLATIEYVPTGYYSRPNHGADVMTHRDSVTFNYGGNSEKFIDNTKNFNDSPTVKFSDLHNEDFKNRLTKFDRHYPSASVLNIPFEKLSDKYKKSIEPLHEKYGGVSAKSRAMDVPVSSALTANGFSLLDSEHLTEPIKSMIENPSRQAIDYAAAKSEAEYDSKYLPSKMKSDFMYEKLKSIMHYSPPSDSGYSHTFDYHHTDDDDIRTSSNPAYDSWPFFYHNPYEYEHMKVDADIQKAKDKRYAIDTNEKVIPVHEYTEPVLSNVYRFTTAAPDPSTPDNPILGNQPFFSFVLSDYFQKNEDDPLTFKGLDWEKDYETASSENEDFKRTRRLGGAYQYPRPNYGSTSEIYDNHNYDGNNMKLSHGESATEKGYQNKHEFDNHEKGDDHKNQHDSAYEHNGNKYKEYKDFADTFANKFGSHDNKKDSKYNLKKNQDKGEKKKGFRRVYHKDEYQEDNEFYDNTNHQANAEEKGSASAHNGGSEAALESHAAVAVGNDANSFKKAGNTHDKKYEKNHHGHGHKKGTDTEFKRYRDVAQRAAKSNNDDYVNMS